MFCWLQAQYIIPTTWKLLDTNHSQVGHSFIHSFTLLPQPGEDFMRYSQMKGVKPPKNTPLPLVDSSIHLLTLIHHLIIPLSFNNLACNALTILVIC